MSLFCLSLDKHTQTLAAPISPSTFLLIRPLCLSLLISLRNRSLSSCNYMGHLAISFLTGLIIRTSKKKTDAIFLHGLVRHAFSPKCPIDYPWPSWFTDLHWDALEKASPKVDAVQLFRYTFPHKKKNFKGRNPDLLTSAEDSGIEEFVRISKYAVEGLSIIGRTGPYSIAAELLLGGKGGKRTQITLYYDVDPDDMVEKKFHQHAVRSLLIGGLQMNTMSEEELDVVFGKIESGYLKGEEVWYHSFFFEQEESEEFQLDEGGKSEHWFFKMQKVPADRGHKILLYLNTLAVAVGKEAALECIYALSDDSFACKMSKVEAVTAWRKCLDKVVGVAPDLRLKASSERKYSHGMEVFQGVSSCIMEVFQVGSEVYADGRYGASSEDCVGRRVSVLGERPSAEITI